MQFFEVDATEARRNTKKNESKLDFESGKGAVYDLIIVSKAKYNYLEFLLIKIFILEFVLNNFLDFHFFRDEQNSQPHRSWRV